jgi:hypothetical protein
MVMNSFTEDYEQLRGRVPIREIYVIAKEDGRRFGLILK